MDGGNYIEIAGGSITEICEGDYNIYAGGNIITTASKSINEVGEDNGVSYNSPKDPPKADDKEIITNWILSTGDKVYWYKGKYEDKSDLVETYKATSGMDRTEKTTTLPNGKIIKEIVNTQQAKYERYGSVGPTPEGKYKISLSPDPNRVADADTKTGELKRNPEGGIEKIPHFIANPNKPGYGWGYSEWGNNRARLEPINITGATSQERDLNSFYFHDSQKGFSHGCTEVESSLFDKLLEYRAAGNNSIEVEIKYPNGEHKTNGGTKKN